MDRKEWKKISHIFDLALTLPHDRRTTYIRQLCADNPELQQEINQLLDSLEESDQMLEKHMERNEALLDDFANHLEKTKPKVSADLAGRTVGVWKLTELLGHGGMGSVYKAKRTDSEIHQIGALKIMHQNLNTPENARRFKLEQQILAGLNHPNIASRIDGGISEDGLPYLVMEYVEGKSILEYCDQRKLTIEDRLQLFIAVCEAVQYAHKNLIVHRDLKPENILVTDEAHVKILDFGIAKLLDPDVYKISTVETRQGLGPMSLEFAAPEQVSGDAITTSTDLYALGILLYKLLAGVHLFDFGDKNYRSIVRTIQETGPPSPSRRLSYLDDPEQLSEIAEFRSINPAQLIKTLNGDLDAITLKALRKEPDARYNSADQLKEDVTSYLQNQPVLAREQAVKYRIKKFVRRHRQGVLTTVSVIILLGFIIGFYTIQLQHQRDQAQQEAERADQITQFLINVFEEADPQNARGDTLNAYQILDRGVSRLETELIGQPAQQAAIGNAIGQVYRKLGSYDQARQLTEQALATRKELYGPSHPDVAASLASLGEIYQRTGAFAKADSCFREALAIIDKGHPQWISYLNGRGQVLLDTGSYKKAEALFREAIDTGRETHGRLHPEVAFSYDFLARSLKEQGKNEDALPLTQQALAITRELYGNNHPDVAEYLSNLGSIYFNMGNDTTAERYHRESLNLYQRLLGENHPDVATEYANIASTLSTQGKQEEAIRMHRQALSILRRFYGEAHPDIASVLHNLGNDLREIGNYDEAESAFRDMLAIDQQLLGPDHPIIGTDKRMLATVLRDKKNYEEAIALHKEALALLQQELPPEHRLIGHALAGYGITKLLQGDPVAAESFLRDGISVLADAYVDGQWSVADARAWLGACLTKLQRYEEAETLLTGAYTRLREARGRDDRYTQQSIQHLVSLYEAWEKPQKAVKYRSLLAAEL